MSKQKLTDGLILKGFPFRKGFAAGGPDDFDGIDAATKWLEERGYSCGSMERHHPIGVYKGDASISKWTNLELQDKAELDGAIITDGGSFRGGRAIVLLKEDPDADQNKTA